MLRYMHAVDWEGAAGLSTQRSAAKTPGKNFTKVKEAMHI